MSTHHHYDQEYDFPEADPVFCLPPWTMDQIPAGEPKQSRRKRGKRSGLLLRLRRRAHRAPLPSILLANVQSLDNKVDEIRARVAFQRDIRYCNVLCFTETWLTRETLSESVQPAGFFTHPPTETIIFLVRGARGYALWLMRRGVIITPYRNSSPSVHLTYNSSQSNVNRINYQGNSIRL
jgi:hypothetical protein